MKKLMLMCTSALILCAAVGAADVPNHVAENHLPYGLPISLEQAKIAAAGARAEGKKRSLTPTIAIVEPSGALVYYERNDGATYAAESLALLKAKGAARYAHGSGEDWKKQIDAKDIAPLILPGPIFPFHGSSVLVSNGKIIGAIGVTGGADSEVAQAGADTIK